MDKDTSFDQLTDDKLIDQICDQFEKNWLEGHPVAAETLLEKAPSQLKDKLADELAAIEKELRSLPMAIKVVGPTRLHYLGDYEILEEIARGGMGVVYRARQVSLDRVVAVKLILAGALASQSDVNRFYAEARSAANLDHPNIVPVYEVGDFEGQHYYSMAFIHGNNLAEKTAEAPIAPTEAARLLTSIARAVDYAHAQGVVHRDLKPSNIMIDEHGQPRITDFGLAKRINDNSHETTEGQIIGSPCYMSPEQADGRVAFVGPASDVYALGGVLYNCLTGGPPFKSASCHETLKQVIEREPQRLRSINASVPRDLETIVHKCLEKEISRRYRTAQELVDELQRFLSGQPIVARPVSTTERSWRWCQRNPMVASLAAVSTVLAILMLIVVPFTLWIRTELARVGKLKSIAESNRLEAEADKLKSEQLLSETRAREHVLQIRTHFGKAADFRRSQLSGRRIESLNELRKAASLQPAGALRSELRNHLINTLTEPDLYPLPAIAEVPDRIDWLSVDTDAKHLVYTSMSDRTAHLRESSSGKEILSTVADQTRINSLGSVWLTNNKGLRVVECWDLRPEAPVKTLSIDNSLEAIFATDKEQVIVVRGTKELELELYDALQGNLLRKLGPISLNDIGYCAHPTAPFLATTSKSFRAVQIRSTESNQVLCEVEIPDGKIHGIEWNPNGQELAVSTANPWINLFDFDPAGGKLDLRQRFHACTPAANICYNTSGSSFVTWGWSDSVALMDSLTGRCMAESKTRVGPNMLGRFSADAKQLSGLVDESGRKLGAWSVEEAHELRLFSDTLGITNPNDYYEGVCIDSARPLLVTLSQQGRITTYNLASGRCLGSTQIASMGGQCMFDQQGDLFTSHLSGVIRWPVREIENTPGELQFGPPEKLPIPSSRNGLAIDAENHWIGSAVRLRGIWLINLDDRGHPSRFLSGNYSEIDFSPDGRWISACEHLSSGAIHDRVNGKEVFKFPGRFARIAGDNRWLGVQGSSTQLYSVGDWKPGPDLGEGRFLNFSPDGSLAVLATDRHDLRVIEMNTFTEIGRFENPQRSDPGKALFSKDNRYLVAAYNRGPEVWVWDLKLIGQGLQEFSLTDRWPQLHDPPKSVNSIRRVRFVGADNPELARDASAEAMRRSVQLVHRVQESKLDEFEATADQLLTEPRSYYSDDVIYNVACAYAQAGVHSDAKREDYFSKAIAILQSLTEAGYFKGSENRDHVAVDTDLTPLLNRKDFNDFLKQISAVP